MKGRKSKQKNKEATARKVEEKRLTEQEIETNASSSMSDDQFLLEIEEYAKRLKETENNPEDKDSTNCYADDTELEIDHLHQVIEDLKEELKTEKYEVENLKDIINTKNKVIESLKDNLNKDKNMEVQTSSRCRYWNRGFCREGDKCHYIHKEEDCKEYLKRQICEDRKCEGRHRRLCRYYNSPKGCYRKDSCQYLHIKSGNIDRNSPDERNIYFDKHEVNKKQEEFKCDNCEFKTFQKVSLKKHVETNHAEISFNETISSFMHRLELEHLAKEYNKYFQIHGFNKEEAGLMEKMIQRHGSYYILRVLE